jgi:hypothetical protein
MIASKPPAEAPIPTIGQPLFDFAFRGEVDLLLTPLEACEGDGFFFAFDFAAIAVLHVTAAMCLLQLRFDARRVIVRRQHRVF